MNLSQIAPKSLDASMMQAKLAGTHPARYSASINSLSIPPSCQLTDSFNVARERLSKFVERMAQEVVRSTGLGWEESDELSHETWPEVKRMFQKAICGQGLVYVLKSSSKSSVYTTEAANWCFRFWHDYLHFKHDLTFSTIDELMVGNFQVHAVEQEFGVGSLEAKIMCAETYGQVMYFKVHGKFVDDQLAFTLNYLKLQ